MNAKDLSYRQNIIDRLDNQTEKGIRKYGGTIDKSEHLKCATQGLEYLAEELTDAIVYIEHEKELIRKMDREINAIKNRLVMAVNALRAIAYHRSPGIETAKKALKDMWLE